MIIISTRPALSAVTGCVVFIAITMAVPEFAPPRISPSQPFRRTRAVPEPIPMRNKTGAVVYYLFFASPNKTGAKIVKDIFNTYRNRGTC